MKHLKDGHITIKINKASQMIPFFEILLHVYYCNMLDDQYSIKGEKN